MKATLVDTSVIPSSQESEKLVLTGDAAAYLLIGTGTGEKLNPVIDVGKHNDSDFDGNAWEGDFEAVADNRHGTASLPLQWAAQQLLQTDGYEYYETKKDRNFVQRAFFHPVFPSGLCGGGSIAVGFGVSGDLCFNWKNGDRVDLGWDANVQFGVGLIASAGVGPQWRSETNTGFTYVFGCPQADFGGFGVSGCPNFSLTEESEVIGWSANLQFGPGFGGFLGVGGLEVTVN